MIFGFLLLVGCGDGSGENAERAALPSPDTTVSSLLFCRDLAGTQRINMAPASAAVADYLRTLAVSAPSEEKQALRQLATTVDVESRSPELVADPRDAAPAARLLADYASDKCDLSIALFDHYRDRAALAEPTNNLSCLRLAALRPITDPTETSAALVRDVASQVGPELRDPLLVFAEAGDIQAADPDASIDNAALAQAAAELSAYTHAHCSFEIGMVEKSLR